MAANNIKIAKNKKLQNCNRSKSNLHIYQQNDQTIFKTESYTQVKQNYVVVGITQLTESKIMNGTLNEAVPTNKSPRE